MKVLVTGGTGYMGGAVVPALIAAGHEVVVLNLVDEEVEGAKVVVGNVLRPETLEVAIEGCDAVVHMAGNVSHDPEDSRVLWAVHVTGTENMLAVAKKAGVRRFLHLSSSGTIAVSETDFVADETCVTPKAIIHELPYYRAKLYSEELALKANCEEMPVVVINPTLLMGPGDVLGNTTKIVWTFLEYGLLAVPRGGIAFVDVRDAAAGIVKGLELGQGGRRYLLNGANMDTREFYERLGRIADKPAPSLRLPSFTRKALKWAPKLGRSGFPLASHVDRYTLDMGCLYWYADASRARSELGWTSRDPTQTLADTVAYAQGKFVG